MPERYIISAPEPHQASVGDDPPTVDPGAAVEGIYLHVPFCFHKCHYCDFYSLVDRPEDGHDRQARFVQALEAEIVHQAKHHRPRPRTVFVGGGTPSLLRPGLWRRLLTTLDQAGLIRPAGEFTVEANPETVTPDLARELASGGVNRVSMGAQTFQPRLLKALERWHEPASVGRAVRTLRAAGIHEINLDLIFAVPGQSLAELESDLEAALALEPTHLSCYGLIFEPHTPLARKMRLGMVEPMDEQSERTMYQRVMDRLAEAGFEHYEISNWSASRRCEHNLLYWHDRNWLGMGPSAASHLAGRRWKNEAHLGRYLTGSPTPPTTDQEQLPPRERIGEQLMLGLRVRQGVRRDWLDRVMPAGDERARTIDQMVQLGVLERTPTHLRLTHDGLFVADTVMAKLL